LGTYHGERPAAGTGLLFILLFALVCEAVLLTPATSRAGNFDVQPVRVSFTARTRAEKLVVRNLGDGDLTIQAKAFKWIQDNAGKDVYEDTSDILVFPRVVRIPRGGQRLIRLGTTAGPAARERTYRVYVEELPVGDGRTRGSGVSFALKIGIPLFVNPLKSEDRGAVGSVSMEAGRLSLRMKNAGNTHLVIQSITVSGRDDKGEEAFSRNLNGWYLLAGASRTYGTQIPPAVCGRLSTITTVVRTTRNSFEETMQVTGGMCGPRTR
jgi:fimbrial chaperone protein